MPFAGIQSANQILGDIYRRRRFFFLPFANTKWFTEIILGEIAPICFRSSTSSSLLPVSRRSRNFRRRQDSSNRLTAAGIIDSLRPFRLYHSIVKSV